LTCDCISLNDNVRPIQHFYEVAAGDEQGDVAVPGGDHHTANNARRPVISRQAAEAAESTLDVGDALDPGLQAVHQSIGERRRQGQNVLRREARYGGGRYPFGYEPYQVDAYWYLRPHPVYAEEVERMALATVSGKSARSIALDLSERGVPTGWAVQQAQQGKAPDWKNSSPAMSAFANGVGRPATFGERQGDSRYSSDAIRCDKG
jgi:hypothetical protein